MAASFLEPLLQQPDRPWILRNLRNQQTLATRIEFAFDSRARRMGLLGRAEWTAGSALILAPCSAVHTFFMRFPIDILLVARDGRALRIYPSVPPWRIAVALRGFAAIELPSGVVVHSNTLVADTLQVSGE